MQWKGSASVDTGRFADKQRKLIKKLGFSTDFDVRVHMDKVALPVLKRWISNRVTEILEMEDEVVINFIFNILENAKKNKVSPDPKEMTISLMGFLERDAKPFMEELWNHIVTASRNPSGIPTKMLDDAKKVLTEQRSRGRNRSKGIKRAAVKEEPVKKMKVEKPAPANPILEIKENIEKIRKQRMKQRAEKKVPQTIADTLSKVIKEKAAKEAEAKRLAEAGARAQAQAKAKGGQSNARRSGPTNGHPVPAAPMIHPDRAMRADAVNDPDRSPTPPPKNLLRSPRRRKSKRRRSMSPSPSPPEEVIQARRAKQKARRAKRRRSRSDSSD